MKLCFLYLFRPSYPPPRARAYWGFSVWETASSLSGSVPAIKQQSQLKTCVYNDAFRELSIKSSLVHSIKPLIFMCYSFKPIQKVSKDYFP